MSVENIPPTTEETNKKEPFDPFAGIKASSLQHFYHQYYSDHPEQQPARKTSNPISNEHRKRNNITNKKEEAKDKPNENEKDEDDNEVTDENPKGFWTSLFVNPFTLVSLTGLISVAAFKIQPQIPLAMRMFKRRMYREPHMKTMVFGAVAILSAAFVATIRHIRRLRRRSRPFDRFSSRGGRRGGRRGGQRPALPLLRRRKQNDRPKPHRKPKPGPYLYKR